MRRRGLASSSRRGDRAGDTQSAASCLPRPKSVAWAGAQTAAVSQRYANPWEPRLSDPALGVSAWEQRRGCGVVRSGRGMAGWRVVSNRALCHLRLCDTLLELVL